MVDEFDSSQRFWPNVAIFVLIMLRALISYIFEKRFSVAAVMLLKQTTKHPNGIRVIDDLLLFIDYCI